MKKSFLNQLYEQGRKETAIGFHHSGSKTFYLLCLKSGARKALGDELHPSLKKLDVSVLSGLIFEQILGIKKDDLESDEIIHYESNTNTALTSVIRGDYQMAFLVNPTKIEQVLEVTGNSLLMPQKSTYFYPKIVTGLVFSKLDTEETILEYEH